MNTYLVYQMGKVGSSSLIDSLEKCGFPKTIARSHKDIEAISAPRAIHTHHHQIAMEIIQRNMKDGSFGNLVIFTMVRDFFRRSVSAFFQNISNPEHKMWFMGSIDYVKSSRIGDIIDFYRSRHIVHLNQIVLPWFDKFSKITGVNVLGTPFDTKAGYATFDVAAGRVFVVRTENLSNLTPVIQGLPGLNQFAESHMNVSKKKWYSEIYKDFFDNIFLSDEEIDVYFNNKTMRHFYNPSEIDAMISRYSCRRAPL